MIYEGSLILILNIYPSPINSKHTHSTSHKMKNVAFIASCQNSTIYPIFIEKIEAEVRFLFFLTLQFC